MKKKFLFLLLIGCLSFIRLNAQQSDSLHHSRFSLNVGVGWTHYVNTLEVGAEYVQPDHAGIDLKFFWEPGYRLSLGLETGYYSIYHFHAQGNGKEANIELTAVPLLLVARMRIIDHFHVSAGTGITYMRNRVDTGTGSKVNSLVSLSTYQFTGSYIYPVGKRFRIAGEVGTFYFGNTNDWMYYVQGVFSIVL